MPEAAEARCVALIPARKGSKGIADKNIRSLCGVPMLVYAIAAARLSKTIEDVFVSTDSPDYGELAAKAGAQVIMRPAELAQDTTPDRPVADHLLTTLSGKGFGAVSMLAWLRPTSPLRATSDIDQALTLFGKRPDTQSLRSLTPVQKHPYWMKTIDKTGLMSPFIGNCHERTYPRRQLLPPAYYPDCLIDIFRPDALPPDGGIFPSPTLAYICKSSVSIDIDVPSDLELAEKTLRDRAQDFAELLDYAQSIYRG